MRGQKSKHNAPLNDCRAGFKRPAVSWFAHFGREESSLWPGSLTGKRQRNVKIGDVFENVSNPS
jgi:hypothetical protein